MVVLSPPLLTPHSDVPGLANGVRHAQEIYIFSPDSPRSAEQLSLEIINTSIRRRHQSKRDIITETLRSGRHLHMLKNVKDYPAREWTKYILDNTEYRYSREYQLDMSFYEYWKPHIDRLIGLGVITNIDSPESEFVTGLSPEITETSLSAMLEFANPNVPEFAFDAALNHLAENEAGLRISEAKMIVHAAKTIQGIQSEPARKLAQEMLVRHTVTNPDVLEMSTALMERGGEIVEEIRTTGRIYVPGADKQVQISRASRTDVELALGRKIIEDELTVQQEIRDSLQRRSEYEFLVTLEGSPDQIMAQMRSYVDNPLFTYRLSISARPIDPALTVVNGFKP